MDKEQLTFWDLPATDDRFVWVELQDIREKQHNLRRGIFKRYDDLKNEIGQLKEEIEALKNQKPKIII